MIDDRELYDARYFDAYYLKDRKRDKMYEQERERILKFYLENVSDLVSSGRILDIGCGVGGFLSRFDDRWEKFGYEPSEFAATKAAKKGIDVVRSLHAVDNESMDMVIFRGTLQHINLPMEALGHATRALKKGGLLCILATPDTDGLVYKLWHNLPALDAPKNWVLWGQHALTNVLERLGYVKVTVSHPYLGTPYARPLRDLGLFLFSLFFGWRKFAFPGNMIEILAVKQ